MWTASLYSPRLSSGCALHICSAASMFAGVELTVFLQTVSLHNSVSSPFLSSPFSLIAGEVLLDTSQCQPASVNQHLELMLIFEETFSSF